MNILKNRYTSILILVAVACLPLLSAAQKDSTKNKEDTIKKKSFDEYLLTRKGIFGKLFRLDELGSLPV